MSLSEQVKWTTQIGIEHTMIHSNGKVRRSMRGNRLAVCDKAKNIHGYDIDEKIGTITSDFCDVLEFSSPILRSWKQAEQWYHDVHQLVEGLDVTPFREGYVAGCGHIHIGNLTKQNKLNFFADVQSRPYLSWAMIDPVDDINAKTMLHYNTIDELRDAARRPKSESLEHDMWVLMLKSNILRYDDYYDTIEWRAFDSAADWEIQQSHIAFIQRYVALIKKLKTRIHPIQHEDEEFLNRYRNVDRCVREFKEFITRTLELPWNEYSWYVDRNLIPKLKNGWSKII